MIFGQLCHIIGSFPESQGDITVWDLSEWSQKQKIYEKDNEIETLDFSHDGKIFATAGKVCCLGLSNLPGLY